jgi:hypothetical protein
MILRTWSPEEKAQLLRFTTGTSRIPVGGFKDLRGSNGPMRFTIEVDGGPYDSPRGHPSLNKLDLPHCKNIEDLDRALERVLSTSFSPFPSAKLLKLLQRTCSISRRVYNMAQTPNHGGNSHRLQVQRLTTTHHDRQKAEFPIICQIVETNHDTHTGDKTP